MYQGSGGAGAGAGSPAPPADLASAYELREQIGRGSFGSAFLAVHKQSRQKYVLKRVRLAKQTSWQRSSTLQERDMVAKLQHPYIVPHINSWVTNGHTVNIVYGYCEKGDLATLLAKDPGTPLPEATLRLWLCQMLLALEYLQCCKVLHRDIKAANVLLTAAGDVQLGDFGLATYRDTGDSAREDTNLVGTPQYLSPELLSQRGYSFQSDTWSLGCVFYELTARRPAFNAFNIHGLVSKIRRQRAAPLPPGYSAEWADLVSLMLRKDPGKRPTVQELMAHAALRPDMDAARARALQLMPGLRLPPLLGPWLPVEADGGGSAMCSSGGGGAKPRLVGAGDDGHLPLLPAAGAACSSPTGNDRCSTGPVRSERLRPCAPVRARVQPSDDGALAPERGTPPAARCRASWVRPATAARDSPGALRASASAVTAAVVGGPSSSPAYGTARSAGERKLVAGHHAAAAKLPSHGQTAAAARVCAQQAVDSGREEGAAAAGGGAEEGPELTAWGSSSLSTTPAASHGGAASSPVPRGAASNVSPLPGPCGGRGTLGGAAPPPQPAYVYAQPAEAWSPQLPLGQQAAGSSSNQPVHAAAPLLPRPALAMRSSSLQLRADVAAACASAAPSGGSASARTPRSPAGLPPQHGAGQWPRSAAAGGAASTGHTAAVAAAGSADSGAKDAAQLKRALALAAALYAKGRHVELGHLLSTPGLVPASLLPAVMAAAARAEAAGGGDTGAGAGGGAASSRLAGAEAHGGSGAGRFSIGDTVMIGSANPTRGVVRWFGPVAFDHAAVDHVGVLLERPRGRYAGTVGGLRYFDAPQGHAEFVRAAALVADSARRAGGAGGGGADAECP